jgi:hypothetical protein
MGAPNQVLRDMIFFYEFAKEKKKRRRRKKKAEGLSPERELKGRSEGPPDPPRQ